MSYTGNSFWIPASAGMTMMSSGNDVWARNLFLSFPRKRESILFVKAPKYTKFSGNVGVGES